MPSVQWGGANSGIINALQDLRAENPNMKIVTSIGGWSKSGNFSTVTADPTIRAKFVEKVMKFVEYTNMDFVDIDWEYPGDARQPDKVDNKNDEGTPNATAADKENYIKLLQDLRTALDKQGKRLGKPYELSVDEGIDYIISKGGKKEKIVVSAAYYTRGWEKVAAGPDKNNPGLYGKGEKINKNADGTLTTGGKNQAPIKLGDGGRAGGVWAYSGLEKLKGAYSGLKEYWDDTAKDPYLYNEKTGVFFTYDNIRSIGEKTKYLMIIT